MLPILAAPIVAVFTGPLGASAITARTWSYGVSNRRPRPLDILPVLVYRWLGLAVARRREGRASREPYADPGETSSQEECETFRDADRDDVPGKLRMLLLWVQERIGCEGSVGEYVTSHHTRPPCVSPGLSHEESLGKGMAKERDVL